MTELKLTPDQRKEIDEYVEVRAKCMAWQPAVNPFAARLAELEPKLLAMAESLDAKEASVLHGNKYVVPISGRERKRTILQVPKLFKKLGMKWVVANCKPTLKAVEKALSAKEFKAFVSEEQTGPRNLGEPVQQAAVKAA
jgi:hypothetical protein